MDIVKFLDKTWQEIPEQDNPAKNFIKNRDNFDARIHQECIMIFKGSREAYRITDGGFVVAKVPKEGDITKMGVFWKAQSAILFAEALNE